MDQLISYFLAGGFFMWPLLLCSVVVVAAVIERSVRLRRSSLIDPGIIEDFQSHVEQGKMELAIARHHSSRVLIGRVLSQGLEDHQKNGTDIDTALLESGDRGLRMLSSNLSLLNVVAKIAPLLGLIGTVQGMIMGFEDIGQSATPDKQALARAIRVALITTFAGLLIAIPAVLAGSYFRSRVNSLRDEFEEILTDVAKSVRNARKAEPKGASS